MRPAHPQRALFIAGTCALLAYAVFGKLSPFDALHYIVGGHASEHATWVGAVHHHLDGVHGAQPLASVDTVVLEGGASATIVIDDTAAAAKVEGPGADSGKISTSVENGKLVIESAKGEGRVKLTLPHLRSLKVVGTGDTEVSGLRDPISIVVSGTGNMKASGDVASLNLVVTGTGHFELSKLQAKDAKIVLIGPGTAAIFATHNLNAMVLGPGTIRYLGNPQVTQNILGPGSVARISEG